MVMGLLNFLLKNNNTAGKHKVDALWQEVHDASRNPVLYTDLQVADTRDGRFELLCLYLAIKLHEIRDDKKLAQALLEQALAVLDQTLREWGVGDLGVGKKMKSLAHIFYGRLASYASAWHSPEALAKTLAVHIPFTENAAENSVKLAASLNPKP
jgi:cytochrome b pre-mRNA-processing protein 3